MDTVTSAPAPIASPLVGFRELPRADRWTVLGLGGVSLLAAVLYLWDLTVSGYANTYYAMAAQAASQSWSAWFFGSLDASNFITLDKPPLSTMVMGLSVRLLGLSSWSILLPQALMGVAAVAVTFLAVRRSFGPVAATIAGAVMAITPAAVLMFRYDNPDALLTLLLVSAAWALLRSLERGGLRWVALAATLVGLAFMTKYLQAFLVLPVFGLVWLVAAQAGWRRRLGGLALATAVLSVVSLAWPLAVELLPVGSKPFIGGSTNGSVFDLILGYDGLGRILGGIGNGGGPVGTGAGSGVAGGPGGAGGFGGEPGLLRLFNGEFGGQVSWLLPYALVTLVAGLLIRGRRRRTDGPRAGYLLWGGWLVATGLVFSFMSGVIHPYYTVVLAPAIGALVGGGTVELWRLRRRSVLGGLGLAVALVASGAWSWALLERSPSFAAGLGVAVLAVSIAAAILVAVPARAWRRPADGGVLVDEGGREGRTPDGGTSARAAGRLALVPLAALVVGLVALSAGPAAYAADTMRTALSGGDPKAGPAVAGDGFEGRGGLLGVAMQPPAGGTMPGGGMPSAMGMGGADGAPSGAGGPGGASDTALVDYLAEHAGTARWIVAVSGSGTAAGIQLASGLPVMAMGGFNGSDAAPTLGQLQAYVASGELRYILLGGDRGGFGGPGGSSSSGVSSWVTGACSAVDTGSSSGTLYDCSAAIGG